MLDAAQLKFVSCCWTLEEETSHRPVEDCMTEIIRRENKHIHDPTGLLSCYLISSKTHQEYILQLLQYFIDYTDGQDIVMTYIELIYCN